MGLTRGGQNFINHGGETAFLDEQEGLIKLLTLWNNGDGDDILEEWTEYLNRSSPSTLRGSDGGWEPP